MDLEYQLYRHPQLWSSPLIELNLGKKMLDKTLYVFGTSDVLLYLENVYRHL